MSFFEGYNNTLYDKVNFGNVVDLNPNIKFAFDNHEDGAILCVYVPSESTGYPEWIEMGLNQSTLLDLNLDLDFTLLNDPDAPPESKQVDWTNEDGSLIVKGDRNKLTLIVKTRDMGTVIRPLDEEESRQFRKKVTLFI